MNIGSRINEFYNRNKGIVTPEKMDVPANLEDGLKNFELTKTLTLTIVYEFADLNAELEDLFHSLSFVDITPSECIEFLGFKDFFTRILKTHDQTLADFVDLQHKLELRSYDFVRKAKLFLDALYAIRHFDRLIFSFFESFGKNLKQDDSGLESQEKIDQSVLVIDKSLQFKNVVGDIFAGMTEGLDAINSVRMDMVGLLNRMDELPKLPEASVKE